MHSEKNTAKKKSKFGMILRSSMEIRYIAIIWVFFYRVVNGNLGGLEPETVGINHSTTRRCNSHTFGHLS